MDKNFPQEQKQVKVYEALKWASSFLQSHDYEPQIAERLILYHTGWSRTMLFAEYRTPLSQQIWEKFQQDIKRAANGYPVQYITEAETFYGRTFCVNNHVLIPRPETEELIEIVLKELNELENEGAFTHPSIVDIGTGSGIIAVTLKLECPSSDVTAIDLSKDALQVAMKNAEKLGANIAFVHGDLLAPMIAEGKRVNVIVSNPPYVRESDRGQMKENVLLHEPEMALFAGDDGLDIYRRLVEEIPEVITTPGLIAFEIGHGQGEQVATLLRNTLRSLTDQLNIQIVKDINEKERVVIARLG